MLQWWVLQNSDKLLVNNSFLESWKVVFRLWCFRQNVVKDTRNNIFYLSISAHIYIIKIQSSIQKFLHNHKIITRHINKSLTMLSSLSDHNLQHIIIITHSVFYWHLWMLCLMLAISFVDVNDKLNNCFNTTHFFL